MRYLDSQLRNVPVFTEGGIEVGRLAGFTLDSISHEIIQYVIKKARMLHMIPAKELLVHRHQVVSLSEEKMVIKDAAITEQVEEKLTLSRSWKN